MTFPRLLGVQRQGSEEVDVGDVQTVDRDRSDFVRRLGDGGGAQSVMDRPSALILQPVPILVGTLLLSWPAIVNQWPLIFYDTGGYLDRGVELSLWFGRSLYYGLFLQALTWPLLGMWPVVFVQSALAAWVVDLCVQSHDGSPGASVVTTALIATLTGYAFFSAQLMPDAFLGIMVAAVYLCACRAERLGRGIKAALGFVITLACLVHMSHLALCAGLVLALAIARIGGLKPAPRIVILPLLAACIILPIGNGLIGGKFGPTPGGPVFILGRLVQDGLAQQVLDELCPDDRFKLCAFKDSLPRNANDFLWGGDEAALRQVGGLEGAGPEAQSLIIESLRRHPLDNLVAAAWATIIQFGWFKTGDDLDAYLWHTRWRISQLYPDLLPGYDAALQQQEVKPDLSFLDRIHYWVGWLAMAVLAWLGLTRAAARPAALFLFTALAGNAAICGIFSNPQGRYQDKVIWLAILGAAMLWQGSPIRNRRP